MTLFCVLADFSHPDVCFPATPTVCDSCWLVQLSVPLCLRLSVCEVGLTAACSRLRLLLAGASVSVCQVGLTAACSGLRLLLAGAAVSVCQVGLTAACSGLRLLLAGVAVCPPLLASVCV